MNSTANRLRRWSRNVHRELSFFFSGMLLIYAVSGLVMNHRDTINPNYSVEQRRYVVGEPLPARDSSLTVRLSDGEAFYEKLTRRPVLGAMTRLHYNPGRWWTWFSDLFAVGLVAIVASGLLLLKGPKGLRGRGGMELAAGIAVPLLFLIFF